MKLLNKSNGNLARTPEEIEYKYLNKNISKQIR